jgi:hypothetical protein
MRWILRDDRHDSEDRKIVQDPRGPKLGGRRQYDLVGRRSFLMGEILQTLM